MKWVQVNERLPAKSIDDICTKTSFGVHVICGFDEGKWYGDLRGDSKDREIVIEWLDESEDEPEKQWNDDLVGKYASEIILFCEMIKSPSVWLSKQYKNTKK